MIEKRLPSSEKRLMREIEWIGAPGSINDENDQRTCALTGDFKKMKGKKRSERSVLV